MNNISADDKAVAGTGLLVKTFQILDLFQTDAPSWTQAELSRATGMNRSAISRLVRYLGERGYLAQSADSGKYRLGPAAIDLGRRAEAGFDLRDVCKPLLSQLALQTDETIILTQFDEAASQVVCVDQIEGRQTGLRVFEPIGTRFPLHAGAAPKAVMALLSETEQTQIIQAPMQSFTDLTVTDPRLLRADLEQTKIRGYAISEGETYPGVAGVAAGFWGHHHRPGGSIAIAGPMQRLDKQRLHETGRLLRKTADDITQLIGGDVIT
ncbi:MAG: IclR family transcriptional regulator [Rhodospirillales bacterium]|nr:IclR family transcriptional regulator [Rhodospirillales bacterium]